ncbi:MAG: histidine phosphatase family protein [Alphaproteobacteria bacterium]|nr:histidine phosphatase family protein [Alphaproteobacteria bacterium]
MTLVHKSFYFMRHGETDWNKQHRPMGQQDIDLNDRGLQQAKDSIGLLHNIKFTTIVTSPLKRAHQTAEIITRSIPKPIHIIDELKECSWGSIEGKVHHDESWFEQWSQNGYINDAEIFNDFSKRVIDGLNHALQLPGPILVVAHGGVYWAIHKTLSMPFVNLPNCTPVYFQSPIQPNLSWMVCNLHDEGFE